MSGRLSEAQVAFYREHGYVVVAELLDAETLAALRRETDAIVAKAAGLSESNEVLDLEDSHTPEAPRVRRIKYPRLHFAFFKELSAYPPMVEVLRQLIGPNLRYQGDKLNLKSAEHGAPVEWHQDWAFYPHTNDDLLAAGILLDDCDEENGPLLVIPGSHRGPIYDHLSDGHFCGAMDFAASGIDPAKAVALIGLAGTVTFHHVRMLHGSALNRSARQRRLLLYQYAAADAWPLLAVSGVQPEKYDDHMVAGEPSLEPRLEAVPVRLPLPPAPKPGSIYELQARSGSRFFDTYEEQEAAAEAGVGSER